LAILEKLAADFPAVPDYRSLLAGSHVNLGVVLKYLDRRAEAEGQCKKGLAIYEKLAADFPAVPDYRSDLADSHTNLGNLLEVLNRLAEAEGQHRRALAILEKLAADFPAVPEYRTGLGAGYCNLGLSVMNGGKPADSLAWYEKAIKTLRTVHEADPQAATAKEYLRNSHWSRAMAYDLLGKHAEAVEGWDQVVELTPPRDKSRYRVYRAASRVKAGMVAEAVAEVVELAKIPGAPVPILYNFACVYAVASVKTADKKGEYADAAMEMLTKAVKAGYKDAAGLNADPHFDPVRDRDDFKKLVADLEAKYPPKKEAPPPEKK
jgi:tetratricopeptide (TPR) repeat protein